MASYEEAAFLDAFRELVRSDGDGGFRVGDVDLAAFAPPLAPGAEFTPAHAALAASVQRRLEEVLLELAQWLHDRTGDRDLVMAGGVALNCVANSRLWREGPFERVWVQPASGDSGTALGAALHVAHALGDDAGADDRPPRSAAAGRRTPSPRGSGPPTSRSSGRPTSPTRSRPRSRTTRSWRGSRAARSSGRARWATARCSPTRGSRATSRSSTTSRAASSSARSRRWCSPSARRRSSTPGRSPARSCSSPTACDRAGAERIPAVVHVDGTARIQTVDRGAGAADGALPRAVRGADGRAGGRQHEPQHRRPADGRRPARRARVLRLGAGRPARASGRSSSAARVRARPAPARGAPHDASTS